MNKVIYLVVAIAVVIGGFFILNTYIYNEKQADTVQLPEGDEALSGTVTKVDLEGMMVDGPGLVYITADGSGEARVIAVPSFGRNMCNEKAELADVSAIKAGDHVEVQGEVGEDNYIIPCMGEGHYLRVHAASAKLPGGSAPATDPALVKGKTWTWEKTVAADGSVVVPKKAGMYSLLLGNDGKVVGKTSCNGFGGDYQLGSDGVISFGPFMSTLMFCEGSQETEFSQAVTASTRYAINAEGKLVLTMKNGGSVVLY